MHAEIYRHRFFSPRCTTSEGGLGTLGGQVDDREGEFVNSDSSHTPNDALTVRGWKALCQGLVSY